MDACLVVRRHWRRCVPLCLVLTATGCSITAPEATAAADISGATGVEGAVVFVEDPAALPVAPTDAALPLASAIRRALSLDPRIQSALARVHVALADAEQARLLPNPIFSVLVKVPEGGGNPNVEASLGLDLLTAMQIPGRTSAADNRVRAASAEAVRVTLDVQAEVEETYASAQALDTLMPVLEQRRGILQRLLEFERTKLAVGEAVRPDVTTLESQWVELGIELDRVREQCREERLHLGTLVGDVTGETNWTLDIWIPPDLGQPAEKTWLLQALAHRPEIKAVEWELAALGDDFSLAKWVAIGPSSLTAAAERDGIRRYGPGASVSIPIFDLGQARRARIRAEIAERRHELTLVGRTVVEEVRRALANHAYARTTLARVRSELVPIQTQRRNLAEQSFRLGQNDVTSTLLAEQDLRAAEAKRIELEREVSVSIVRLRRAVGGSGIANQIKTNNQEQDRK